MPVFVGCDLGTAGAKAAVIGDDGAVLGEAFEESVLHRPAAGQLEQDMREIEASAHRVIARALSAAGSPRAVAAVAISSQMSGIGTIDEHFEPATRYDSWLDNRCEPYIEQLADRAEEITRIAGCPPTYSHLPKMLYWQGRSDDWPRIRAFVPPSSYVSARLAGLTADEAYIDSSYLHFTNLADTADAKWSDHLVEITGMDAARLPRIVAPTSVIGTVTAAAAEATGLPAGTPIAAGAGDTAAAALGAGVTRPGQAFDVAGTASVLGFCLSDFAPDLAGRSLMASRGLVPGTFVSLAFINGGGLALRWFRDELAPELAEAPNAYDRLMALAETVALGAEGLFWYPHLQGRVVPPQPQLRAAWIGLTSRHTRAHLVRAILEGIAFEYRDWSERASAGSEAPVEVRAVGGGAASPVWNGIKADVVGIPWVPVTRQECGVLGDAVLAAAAAGAVDDIAATAEAWQGVGDAVQPSPARHYEYEPIARRYRSLAAHMPALFDDPDAGVA